MHRIITLQSFVLLFMFLAAIPVAHSQSDSTTIVSPRHLWSLDFSIGKDFQLDAFLGTTLSMSRFITHSEKIRVGVSSSLGAFDSDHDGNSFTADTLSTTVDYDNSNTDYSIQLCVQYLSYASPNAPTTVFIGIGPLVQYDRRDQERLEHNDITNQTRRTYYYAQHNSTVSVGALASLGAEWYFSEHMSLHAEYGIQVLYSRSTSSTDYRTAFDDLLSNRTNYRSESVGSGYGWSVTGSRVLFGLSVTF